MIEFVDRVPEIGKENRKKITYPDGREEFVTIESADDTSKKGTNINRSTMMAIQGFITETTVFNPNGSIVKTNDKGETLTIVFNNDGSITKTFVGEKTITMTIKFNTDGSIVRYIS